MSELANFKAPQLVECSTNYTYKDLQHEDQYNLLVGLHFKLWELSPRLARVLHYFRVMACVYDNPIYPFGILEGCTSQQYIIVVQRECVLTSTYAYSALELVQLIIRRFTYNLASERSASCSVSDERLELFETLLMFEVGFTIEIFSFYIAKAAGVAGFKNG